MTGTTAGRSVAALQNAGIDENRHASDQDGADLGREATAIFLALTVVAAAMLRLVGGGDQLWYD